MVLLFRFLLSFEKVDSEDPEVPESSSVIAAWREGKMFAEDFLRRGLDLSDFLDLFTPFSFFFLGCFSSFASNPPYPSSFGLVLLRLLRALFGFLQWAVKLEAHPLHEDIGRF